MCVPCLYPSKYSDISEKCVCDSTLFYQEADDKFGNCQKKGCTAPGATNFDPTAYEDNGSCTFAPPTTCM